MKCFVVRQFIKPFKKDGGGENPIYLTGLFRDKGYSPWQTS